MSNTYNDLSRNGCCVLVRLTEKAVTIQNAVPTTQQTMTHLAVAPIGVRSRLTEEGATPH